MEGCLTLRVSREGHLIDAPDDVGDGVVLVGETRGRIDSRTLRVTPDPPADVAELTDAEALLLHGDAISLRIVKGRLAWIAPDLSGLRDVFWCAAPDGGWWVMDDFFRAVALAPSRAMHAAAVRFFVDHGYFADGQTWCAHIHRVRAGCRLRFFPDGIPREEGVFAACDPAQWLDKLHYAGFRDVLDSILEVEAAGNSDGLLLSGGCDSGVIAAHAALRRGVAPKTFTHSYVQRQAGNVGDALAGAHVAAHLGLSHEEIRVDFNELRLADLADFADALPLAAHFALNFRRTMDAAAASGCSRVWCGQNADSIYNLGPTSRLRRGEGKGDLIKRYFLSREFLRSLPDVSGTRGGPWWGWATALGTHMAGMRYHTSFRPPRNFNELLQAFRASDHYLALLPRAAGELPPVPAPLSTREARERLFDEKLSSFLVGRDARCIPRLAELAGIGAVRPYASAAMMMFFRSLEMTLSDTLRPKRFLHRYHRELLGTAAHRKLTHLRARNPAPKSDDWQPQILQSTEIGQALVEAAEAPARTWGLSIRHEKIQPLVSLYWVARMSERIRQTPAREA